MFYVAPLEADPSLTILMALPAFEDFCKLIPKEIRKVCRLLLRVWKLLPDPTPSKQNMVEVVIGEADNQVVGPNEPPPADEMALNKGKLY